MHSTVPLSLPFWTCFESMLFAYFAWARLGGKPLKSHADFWLLLTYPMDVMGAFDHERCLLEGLRRWLNMIHCIVYSAFFWSYFFQKKHCFLFQYRSCRSSMKMISWIMTYLFKSTQFHSLYLSIKKSTECIYCLSLLKGIAPQMNPHQQLVKQIVMICLDAIADGDQHQEPLQAAGTGFAWTGRGEIGWRFLQCCWDQRSVYRVYLDPWWDLFWQAPNVDVATQPTVVLDGSNMSSDNQKQRPQQCNATDGFEGLCHVIYLNYFEFVYVCLMWCHFSLGWHLGTSFVCWGTALADGKDRANSFLAQAELQKYTLGSLVMLVEVLMES